MVARALPPRGTPWGAWATSRAGAKPPARWATRPSAAPPGATPGKLELGLPAYEDAWAGSPALDQLRWIAGDGAMGVGVWDAQLSAPAWRTPAAWRTLAAIRG